MVRARDCLTKLKMKRFNLRPPMIHGDGDSSSSARESRGVDWWPMVPREAKDLSKFSYTRSYQGFVSPKSHGDFQTLSDRVDKLSVGGLERGRGAAPGGWRNHRSNDLLANYCSALSANYRKRCSAMLISVIRDLLIKINYEERRRGGGEGGGGGAPDSSELIGQAPPIDALWYLVLLDMRML